MPRNCMPAFLSAFVRALRTAVLLLPAIAALSCRGAGPVALGSRLEPFMDAFLLERLEGASLKMHEPVEAGVALRFDRPWEGPFSAYVTVLHDGAKYRMYYRGLPESKRDGSDAETTCYAESADGIAWTKPDLGLFEVRGTRSNNVVLAGQAPFSHNFSPFLDTRPGVPAGGRFKAVAGTVERGLFGFVSADGVSWRRTGDAPLITRGAFDSQNVAFWSASEGRYVLYLRTWTGGDFAGKRSVSRATSEDFLRWSDPQPMEFGGTPPEDLYTSQTHPYFRAPHVYVAIPMRFLPGRRVLTDAQARSLGVDPGYSGDCAEAVLMTSRGGTRYDRTFMEAFIRPGLDAGNWASRAGLTALGVVPTGEGEMSLYKQAHYAQPGARLLRYRLRTDGFASLNAPYRGGSAWTRPFTFTGGRLVLNFSTGAAGGIRAELLDEAGAVLAESQEMVGDDLARPVAWKAGAALSALAGRPVRLHLVMKDADLYSMRFTD